MKRKILNINIGVNIAINAALALPPVALMFKQWRLRQGQDPEKDQIGYPLGVFRKHAGLLGAQRAHGLRGADVLEIGPGGTIGTALLMLLAGANSATCIDALPWAAGAQVDRFSIDLIAAAAQDPANHFVAPEWQGSALADPTAVANLLVKRIIYRAPESINTTTLPDASYDCIFSHACFEHFADPATAIAQIARLLRPGGVTSHQIDLRDHRDFSHPLEHLRYSDTIWWLANVRLPNGVRNRWRASEYYAAFEQQGLHLVQKIESATQIVTAQQRQHFDRHFRTMTLEDLGITGILVVGVKQEE